MINNDLHLSLDRLKGEGDSKLTHVNQAAKRVAHSIQISFPDAMRGLS